MPKRYNIKWSKSDQTRLSRAVQKFNAKLTRLGKQNPSLKPYLPERINVKEAKNKISTRNDYNNLLKSIDRFFRKGAAEAVETKGGVKTTKYELNELRIRTRAINTKRRNELRRAEISKYKGNQSVVDANNLRPKVFRPDNMDKRSWDKFVKSTEKQFRDNYYDEKYELYKQNYIKGLMNEFGEKGKSLINLVEQIPPDEFIDLYYNDPVLDITFIYDPIEQEQRLDNIEKRLNDYIENR